MMPSNVRSSSLSLYNSLLISHRQQPHCVLPSHNPTISNTPHFPEGIFPTTLVLVSDVRNGLATNDKMHWTDNGEDQNKNILKKE